MIDLTDEPTPPRKKTALARNVWVALHRLEAGGYECIGDYVNDRNHGCLSHNPETFDTTILGVFDSLAKANSCAHDKALECGIINEYGGDDDESDSDAAVDYTDEGAFLSGADSGDVNTFSQRVLVREHLIR